MAVRVQTHVWRHQGRICRKNSATDGISFTALDVIESKMTPEEPRKESGWTVKQIIICSPEGEELELRSDNLLVVSKLLSKMNS